MEKKNIDFWEEVLKDPPDSFKNWFEAEKLYLNKNITKNAKVLDVGCGNGKSLKDILDITQNLTGIDHEKRAVDNARRNFSKNKNVKIVLADARILPFHEKSFDFVICIGTFANFVGYENKALSEMRRVLKKNGSIIISVYSEDAFEDRIRLYNKLNSPIKEINGTTVIFDEEINDNMSRQFTKRELFILFKNNRLKIIEIKKVGVGYICKLKK